MRKQTSVFTFHDVSINTANAFKSFTELITFTFHDVSINMLSQCIVFHSLQHFTFHDVSINTVRKKKEMSLEQFFTFHDVSINTIRLDTFHRSFSPLHSTMFLLIHSTIASVIFVCPPFTFHDVSINTSIPSVNVSNCLRPLHSTMFLLIPVVYSSLQYRYNLTTFCQSCHFIIFILIFIFLDSSHF